MAGRRRGGQVVDHHQQWPITDDLATLRDDIQRFALAAGLTGARLDDLVIAANEAAINVLEHGGGVGTLVMSSDGAVLAVEVADELGTLRPGAVPGQRPSGRSVRGFGLWLMGELCDSVTIEQVPGRSTIRLSMNLDTGGPAAGAGIAPVRGSIHPI
ncbi:ATP-binding protein [Microbispora triticiradicis]|uniref:ATP-binding protein n=3 Tax=Microbispora TaxID=2005 RepID=A0ABY3M4X4_9ACTN|nr:ATP-binding protein [Microbispora triticiradicis]TLP66796.1 ATP-binding protein [Microbispora fusca]TYB67388.1 ATP-binding protein [Microbispora tritici]